MIEHMKEIVIAVSAFVSLNLIMYYPAYVNIYNFTVSLIARKFW